jgi:pimeloyl-ACP methyl ester carboxylesterase
MSFVVPAPKESFDVDLEDDAKIRVRRHGNPDGMRLTVTHGNGFASDAYLPFWQLLMPNYDVLVFDFRNHGQNAPAEPAPNVPPPDHPRYAAMEVFENKLTEWALGRRRRFASIDELANEYTRNRARPSAGFLARTR